MEWYKKYRPRKLARIVGNEQTIAALQNMLTRKTLPHTVLFHGPSGCGKTTLARIVRTELGCHDLDFKEINSASFRGIDSIREIQRGMNLSPAAGPVRVWLIDEVHKWTNDAQNAALKMLEDTPDHAYFLLCTTDPSKLIKAVLTRCCEMPVRLLTETELESLAARVCERESVVISNDIRDEIISSAQGSARTLLVLLEKVSGLNEKDQQAAIQAKLAEENEAIDLCRALIKKESWKKVARILANLKSEPEETRWSILGYARQVLLKEGTYQAYLILDIFKTPFYESKGPGLACACFEAISSKS
jgi:DNA polymerase III gamma/tau subunit